MATITTDYHFAPIPEGVLYDPALSANAVRVYGCLMRHGLDAERCYPSRERIAELCAMSISTAKRAVAELVEHGWVERVERYDKDGAQTSNGYHVRATPPGHGWTAPRVTGEPPPGSPVTHEREQVNESNRTSTLTLLSQAPAATETASEIEAEFETWWRDAWCSNRRVSKADARGEYRRARKDTDAATLFDGAQAYARLMKAQGTEPKHILHPNRWLKKRRWEDETPAARNPFQGPEMRFG